MGNMALRAPVGAIVCVVVAVVAVSSLGDNAGTVVDLSPAVVVAFSHPRPYLQTASSHRRQLSLVVPTRTIHERQSQWPTLSGGFIAAVSVSVPVPVSVSVSVSVSAAAAAFGEDKDVLPSDNDPMIPSSSWALPKANDTYAPDSKRTLYDVLGCAPDATREELKRRYVELARLTHPDALIGKTPTTLAKTSDSSSSGSGSGSGNVEGAIDPLPSPSSLSSSPLPDFNEVARAWKILSDPLERRRYDRSLRAQRLSRDLEDAAERAARAAAPRMQRMFEKVAVPLIRRTTATAVATVEAARQDLIGERGKADRGGAENDGAAGSARRGGGGNIGSAFQSAIRASRQAGEAIDRMELLEKAEELERKANEESEKADRLRDELASVVDRRLRIALRTPEANLSSLEALKILDGFNTVDSLSLVESIVMLRKTLTAEIAALEENEREYYDLYDEKATSLKEFSICADALDQAKANAEAALEAERRAREALAAAQELVVSSRQAVTDGAKALDALDANVKRASAEADRSGAALKRRQERVRKALLKKEEALRIERAKVEQKRGGEGPSPNGADADRAGARGDNHVGGGYHFDASGMAHAAIGDGESERDLVDPNEDEIEKLQERERYLIAESARLQDRADRLQSRANKLSRRAAMLKSRNATSS